MSISKLAPVWFCYKTHRQFKIHYFADSDPSNALCRFQFAKSLERPTLDDAFDSDRDFAIATEAKNTAIK